MGLRPVNGVSCASRRVNRRIGGMMNLDDLKVYQMAMTFQHLNGEIDTLLIKLNNYIKSIGKTNAGNDR